MDINELRKLVRQRHRAATSKVSRLRSKGVEVGGTKYDPRRDTANIKRYTRAQLTSYLRKLNGFTERSNSFVANSEGTPIPGAVWRRYKQVERSYNQKGQRRDNAVANIKLPGQDMTIGQRSATMRPSVLRAGGEASTKPYAGINRTPAGIPGVEALNKLINDMERRNSKTYEGDYIKKQRVNAEKLMNAVGFGENIERLRGLSDDQFDILFNETDFPSGLGMGSDIVKMRQKGNKNEAFDQVLETLEGDVNEAIEWAHTLPRRRGKK